MASRQQLVNLVEYIKINGDFEMTQVRHNGNDSIWLEQDGTYFVQNKHWFYE